MYVKVLRWRLLQRPTNDVAFRDFVRRISEANAIALRPLGLLDGFMAKISADTVLSINFYETQSHAERAFVTVTGTAAYAAAHGIELLAHDEGEAFDLPFGIADVPAGAPKEV